MMMDALNGFIRTDPFPACRVDYPSSRFEASVSVHYKPLPAIPASDSCVHHALPVHAEGVYR